MAGLDLGDVLTIISGSERVHAATIRRFTERFARFNLPDTAMRPSYGLAEATRVRRDARARAAAGESSVSTTRSCPPATRSGARTDGGASSWSATATPRSSTVRIVDPDTRIGESGGKVGEIWVHGDNVAQGYWRNPQQSEHTFGGSSSIRRRARRPDRGCAPATWVSSPTASCSSSAASRIC